MNDDNKIKSIAPDGQPDGGFYAVSAAGNLVSAKALKDGMRWASAAEVAAVTKHAEDLAKKDPKPAPGPLAKGG